VRLAIALLLSACFVESASRLPEGFATCEEEDGGDISAATTLTYHQDTAPIIEARCAGCHRTGGIAPFAIESYEDAAFNRAAIRSAVAADRMPPWDAGRCCRDYQHDRSLTPGEKAQLLSWIDQGTPEGDPASPAPPLEIDPGGLSRVDLRLEMAEPFTPRAVIGNDEVRCFLIDWPLAEPTFVTGIDVIPGNSEVVHHVTVMAISRADAGRLEEKDGADGRPGFDCWGDLGAQPEAYLGGWTPGQSGHDLPAGLGREIPGGTQVLLQMHYDVSSGAPAPDRTAIELKLDDAVERQARTLPVGNPQWLIGDGLRIAAGDPDAVYWFAYDPTPLLSKGTPLELFSATIHMHDYGSAGSVAILRASGEVECLLDVDRYDFAWHGEYFFAAPVIIEPGDRIYVECHFDNTASNQKLIDGELEAPRDLSWGTDREMCGALLMMAELER
jgi:hypothetical protein